MVVDEEDILRSLRKRQPAVPKPKDAGAWGRDVGNETSKDTVDTLGADPSASEEDIGIARGHDIKLGGGGFAPVAVLGGTCECLILLRGDKYLHQCSSWFKQRSCTSRHVLNRRAVGISDARICEF